MTRGELKAVFKVIEDTSVKKVIDNVKGEVRSIGSVMQSVSKKMGSDIFNNVSEAFKKLNPELMKLRNVITPPGAAPGPQGLQKLLALGPLFQAGKIKGLKDPGGKDLAKVLGLPDINDLGKGVIRGLREVGGADLAKVQSMGEFGRYEGAPPPKLKDDAKELPYILRRFASEAFLSYKAIQLFQYSLRALADELKKVLQFSHQIYGASLSSGLNLNFIAQRQMTASALGVSENDIYRFRQSIQVMHQLSGATAEISKNAPQLAYVTTQFKIMQFDLLALGSTLEVKIAPTLNIIVNLVGAFAKVLDDLAKSRLFKLLSLGLGNPSGVGGLYLSTFLGGGLGKELLNRSKEGLTGSFGAPSSYMKQLPVGAFEKMGLIIGGGLADKALEYQRRTASAVEKIHQVLSQNTKSATGYYMSRNPNVAGP